MTRAAILNVMQSAYIETAELKGMPMLKIIRKHAFPNAIAPIVKEIADDNGEKLKVVKVNIDESPQTPGTYGIRSIPTVLVFKDGQVVSQLTGARPKGDFEELVSGVI